MSNKETVLKKAFGKCWRSNSELLFRCPKCNHDKLKLSVNIEKNAFKCWICNFSGNKISQLFGKYSSQHYAEWIDLSEELDLSKYEYIFDETPPEIQNIELPTEFKTLTGKARPEMLKPLQYLYSRGLTNVDILKWKIGYCDYGEYEGRIIVPSYDTKGSLNYFIARTYIGDWIKYKNPSASKNIIFNDLNINWQDDIVIVEGVFDAIKHKNCIPILGSSLRESHKLFEKICRLKKEVYLALDSDAKEKELQISKKFIEYGIRPRALSSYPYADLAELPRMEFSTRKQNADFITDLDYLHYKLDF